MRNLLRALSLTALTVLASALPAQPAKPSQFVITKGKDTVAVEIFTRDASTLSSEIYQTNGLRTQYTANLKPDHSVQQVELTRQGRQGAGIGISVFITDTLVTALVSAGGEAQKLEFATRGKATPFLAVSFALAEQIVMASNLTTGQSVKWTAVRLGTGDTTTVNLTRFNTDSISFVMPDLEIRVAVSAKGEVIGGRHIGQGWLIERKVVSK